MNKTQTILLSAGVVFTTASAVVLSQTFLVEPYTTTSRPLPVEAQRDTGEVELVRTPVKTEPRIERIPSGYPHPYTPEFRINCDNRSLFNGDKWITFEEIRREGGEWAVRVITDWHNGACN